jgi:hypothetical protein
MLKSMLEKRPLLERVTVILKLGMSVIRMPLAEN